MSFSKKVFLALLAGLLLGFPLAGSQAPFVKGILAWIAPLGSLFMNAIRMVVIPLVITSVASGVTTATNPQGMGRTGAKAMALFVLLVTLMAVFSLLVGGPLLAHTPFDATAAAALRMEAINSKGLVLEGAKSIPNVGAWLVSLVPTNPIKAAADGSMLPLIVASLTFSIALLYITPTRRYAVMEVVEGIQEASLVCIGAILKVAPFGVFALAVSLASKVGFKALGMVAGYMVIVALICVLFTLLVLYPAATWIGGVPLRQFVRAALPAQAIAFSTSSSLAALPAMMESATHTLQLPPVISRCVIPFACAIFRCGAGVGQTLGVLFIARLYGMELHSTHWATIGIMAVLTSFSVPGIPGGSVVVMAPVLMAVGIPVEGLGILLGADILPDMFRTATNVTGHLTAAVLLARGEKSKPLEVSI